ncbi:MAG: T9SS type A sorting domain-containing protein [bacterium]
MIAKNTFKLHWIFKIILLFCFILGKIYAQELHLNTREEKPYSIAERDNLFLQALSVLPESKIPFQYRSSIPEPTPLNCATMILAEVRQNFDLFSVEQKEVLNNLFDRPDLPLNFVSSARRFKIHYTETGLDAVPLDDLNNNGIPDFVEEVAQAFENSFQIEVGALGYRKPPDDAEVDEPEYYDVYITNLGYQFYGFTQGETNPPETPQNDLRSYIVIDNDFNNGHFTTGISGAQVTAAHEYYHAIQFGYRIFLNDNERFYYEFCSVWMEDVVYDEINDYYQYLPIFFRHTEIPFNKFDHLGHYLGEALWNHFLVKKYQENDKGFSIIRRTWELIQSDELALVAIDKALTETGSSFKNDFAEFSRWNYFTGMRADSINFYDESRVYPEIKLNSDFTISSDTTVVDSSLSLTHKYFKFTTLISGNFFISGDLEEPENWRFAAITVPTGSAPNFHIFNLLAGQNLGFLPSLSEIVLIPINLQIFDGENLPQLSSAYLSFNFEVKQGSLEFPVAQGIFQIYPNPFVIGQHNRIFFDYVPFEGAELEVRIFSSDGRIEKTAKFQEGSSFIGQASYSWNGRNENNELVPSGIYVVQLKQGAFVDIKKFAVIRLK